MSDWIIIAGVSPYDGRYEFDLGGVDGFKTREWMLIKQYANVHPIDYFSELGQGDAALMMILTALALRRAGKVSDNDIPDLWDRFLDVEYGAQIQVEFGDRDGDADGPPPQSSSVNGASSGAAGKTALETSELTPASHGSQPSATSDYAPAMSES